MQVRLSTATRVRSGATLSSTRERLSVSSRLSCGLHVAVAGGGVRAELWQMRNVVLCRTGVIHDPMRQTCIFDTEWNGGSSGGGRRRLEASGAIECVVDPSEVTQELGEVKQQLRKVEEVQAQQLRKAEQVADDMKRQLRKAEEVADDMAGELREVKALLKQLAAAQ